MGQEVKMDEYEGGVRPSVLYRLAEPLCGTRPRQGRPLPVHCVKGGNLRLISPGLPSYWLDLNEHELLLTTSTFSFVYEYFLYRYFRVISYYLVKVYFLTGRHFYFHFIRSLVVLTELNEV